MNRKRGVSPRVASDAGRALQDPNSSKKERELAAAALAEVARKRAAAKRPAKKRSR